MSAQEVLELYYVDRIPATSATMERLPPEMRRFYQSGERRITELAARVLLNDLAAWGGERDESGCFRGEQGQEP